VTVDQATGLLVPANDVAALRRALVELWSDSERADRLGLAGQRRLREQFSLERMLDRSETVYRRALGNGRKTAP
jgi:glycosyltransferase involved in cell wall biosynthesis